MPQTEAQKAASKRYREKQKALGIKPKITDERRAKMREYMREKRAKAKAEGREIPSDSWFKNNPEKNAAKGRRWREQNWDRAKELDRQAQARRRSTPWGRINNRLWTIVHQGVRANSSGPSKYSDALGYTWSDLRKHLESQFTEEMSWDNWGEYWELDHIKMVSEYRYESIECPTFKECWGLENLRPLLREENQRRRA